MVLSTVDNIVSGIGNVGNTSSPSKTGNLSGFAYGR